MEASSELTRKNIGDTLNIAFNYGGRRDRRRRGPTRRRQGGPPAKSTRRRFVASLSPELSDPEPCDSTSVSSDPNFLLWEWPYSDLVFTEVLWPDFRREQLFEAVEEDQQRERRTGARQMIMTKTMLIVGFLRLRLPLVLAGQRRNGNWSAPLLIPAVWREARPGGAQPFMGSRAAQAALHRFPTTRRSGEGVSRRRRRAADYKSRGVRSGRVLWTRSHGKVRVLAKGIRKATSRLGGISNPRVRQRRSRQTRASSTIARHVSHTQRLTTLRSSYLADQRGLRGVEGWWRAGASAGGRYVCCLI